MPGDEVRAMKTGDEEINVHMREQLRTGAGGAEAHTKRSFNSDNNKRTALRSQCLFQVFQFSNAEIHKEILRKDVFPSAKQRPGRLYAMTKVVDVIAEEQYSKRQTKQP